MPETQIRLRLGLRNGRKNVKRSGFTCETLRCLLSMHQSSLSPYRSWQKQ